METPTEPVDTGFEELDRVTAWPEWFLTVGSALGAVALVLPWLRYSSHYDADGLFEPRAHVVSITTFSGWGKLYGLAWVMAVVVLLLRTVFADAMGDRDLVVGDWFAFVWCAVLMSIGLLAVLDSLIIAERVHVRIDNGWWAGGVGCVFVFLGAFMLRWQTSPGEADA
jgi:hypothetical protein